MASRATVVRAVRRQQRQRRRVVFTNGCFDLLHVGHVRYLTKARALGDCLVVGLNSDRSVRRLKGAGRPLQSARDRAEILQALRCVDLVTVFDGQTPEALIRAIHPDILVKGGDWPRHQIVGGAFVQSYGGRVVRVSFVPGRSTTRIARRLRAHA